MHEHLKSLSEFFNTFGSKQVSEVTFIHDYYELWMNRSYIRFLSETYIEIPNDETHYYLGEKKGNYHFSQLLGQTVENVIESDKSVQVRFENGIKITVDTCLEPPSDNFHMGTIGKLSAQI